MNWTLTESDFGLAWMSISELTDVAGGEPAWTRSLQNWTDRGLIAVRQAKGAERKWRKFSLTNAIELMVIYDISNSGTPLAIAAKVARELVRRAKRKVVEGVDWAHEDDECEFVYRVLPDGAIRGRYMTADQIGKNFTTTGGLKHELGGGTRTEVRLYSADYNLRRLLERYLECRDAHQRANQ
jgi:hypothetical protein